MTGPAAYLINGLDLMGIAVFAISGALAAAQKRQTLVTFAFFALITGVGGGTVRDLIIGAPVFWVHDRSVLLVIFAVVLMVWFTPVRWWPERMLDWADAIGLAAYSVFGAAKSLAYGIDPLAAITMGVVTGCVGGIIRDVLAGEPSILMRPELYVTAAALAAAAYVFLNWLGLGQGLAATIAATAGFALRGLAIWRGLALPAYRQND